MGELCLLVAMRWIACCEPVLVCLLDQGRVLTFRLAPPFPKLERSHVRKHNPLSDSPVVLDIHNVISSTMALRRTGTFARQSLAV